MIYVCAHLKPCVSFFSSGFLLKPRLLCSIMFFARLKSFLFDLTQLRSKLSLDIGHGFPAQISLFKTRALYFSCRVKLVVKAL